MAITDDEFNQHAVHSRLKQFNDGVTTNFKAWQKAHYSDNFTDQDDDKLVAFHKVIKKYENALSGADRTLLSVAFLNDMEVQLRNLVASVPQGQHVDVNALDGHIRVLLDPNAGNSLANWLNGLMAMSELHEFDFRVEQTNKNMEEARKTSEQAKKEAAAFLNEISEDKHSVKTLISAKAGEIISDKFSETANREAESAKQWDKLTFAFIGAAIIVVLMVVLAPFIGFDTGSSWPSLIKNASVVGLLVFASAICGNRAKMHHGKAQSAEWLSLQVKAVDPYSKPFDREKREEFMSEVGKEIFTRGADSSGGNKKEDVNIAPISLIVEAARKLSDNNK